MWHDFLLSRCTICLLSCDRKSLSLHNCLKSTLLHYCTKSLSLHNFRVRKSLSLHNCRKSISLHYKQNHCHCTISEFENHCHCIIAENHCHYIIVQFFIQVCGIESRSLYHKTIKSHHQLYGIFVISKKLLLEKRVMYLSGLVYKGVRIFLYIV